MMKEYLPDIVLLGHETAQQVMQVTLESRALLQIFLKEVGNQCDYREPGNLRLALSEEEARRFQGEIRLLQQDGCEAEWWDREQVQEHIQIPLGPEIVGGRHRQQCGLVHSARLVHQLVETSFTYG